MSTLKIIRYLFILAVYNVIIALIAYGTAYISDIYDFEYSTWSFVDWWLFISILIVISIIGLYLAPFYDECLELLLDRIITKLKIAKKEDETNIRKKIKELEDWLKELKEEDEEA